MKEGKRQARAQDAQDAQEAIAMEKGARGRLFLHRKEYASPFGHGNVMPASGLRRLAALRTDSVRRSPPAPARSLKKK